MGFDELLWVWKIDAVTNMAAAIVKDGRSKIFFAGTGVTIPKEFIFSLNKEGDNLL